MWLRCCEQPDADLGFVPGARRRAVSTQFEERFGADPSGDCLATVRFGTSGASSRDFRSSPTRAFRICNLTWTKTKRCPKLTRVSAIRQLTPSCWPSPNTLKMRDNDQAVVDYIVEYTKAHLSPVVARALRVYRERGLAAMTEELKITKAPKKTLAAIVRLARSRFAKVALIFDGFDLWYQVPAETRSLIAGTLSEIRWMLESDVVMVFVLETGEVPELEEQFGGGTRVEWGFSGLASFEKDSQALDTATVDSWMARAAVPGAVPLTMDDPVLSALMSDSEGFSEFAFRAATAIEDAADRAASTLDEEALNAARVAQPAEANMS